MDIDWQVVLDHDGRVLVGKAEADVEGRYLVLPQPDGNLELRALERVGERGSPAPPGPEPVMAGLDEDAAESELARWGARALGDLSQAPKPAAATTPSAALPLIDPRRADRPQPAALESTDVEANSTSLSAVDAAYRYWLIQNRDAHDLFRTRGSSRRSATSDASSSKSPA